MGGTAEPTLAPSPSCSWPTSWRFADLGSHHLLTGYEPQVGYYQSTVRAHRVAATGSEGSAGDRAGRTEAESVASRWEPFQSETRPTSRLLCLSLRTHPSLQDTDYIF